jgi:hypothetical protein
VSERRNRRSRRAAPSGFVRFVAAAAVLQLLASVGGLAVVSNAAETASAAAAPSTTPELRAAPAPPDPRVERERAVRALLDARGAAVLARNRAAFLATVSPSDPAFAERQAALFDALAEVPLSAWTYELDPTREQRATPELDARYGADAWWAPDVVLRYAIAGFDPEPTYAPQRLTFVRTGGAWTIAGDDDFAAAGERSSRGLWDAGPVVTYRGEHTLVLGHPGSQDLMRQIAGVVDAAVPRVNGVWGTAWSASVVVLVPDDEAELDALLGGTTDLSRIAAVATAEVADLDNAYRPVGDRVIVNPPNFAKLGRLGRQVVLTHEVVHVATRQATGPDTPTWLVEGLADYIGYLEVPVPVTTAARELAAAVRNGRVPEALPANADFDGANADLALAYESSWLAFRLLVEQHGLEATLRFYRAVGASRDAGTDVALETAFARELGTTTDAFTAAWRDDLVSTFS